MSCFLVFYQTMLSQARFKLVQQETERVATWTKKYIDSDIWQPGVPQRILAVELRKFLKVDLDKTDKILAETTLELDHLEVNIVAAKERLNTLIFEIDALTKIIDEVELAYKISTGLSVAEELREAIREQEEADMKVQSLSLSFL